MCVDVTIFSSAACGKCVATKAAFRKYKIPFTEVRVDQLPEEAMAYIQRVAELIGRELPFVMVFRSEDDEVPDVWNDFHPDLVSALA